MGKKKVAGLSHTTAKKAAQRASKYEELASLNDRLLAASALSPSVKELESSCQQIHELIEQIRALQNNQQDAEQTSAASPRESRFPKFVSWCSEHDVSCDKIELAMFDDLGVGVRATQKIQHHEMFLSIPRSLMMTVDLQSQSIGTLLRNDPIASRMPNIALAMYLLSEKFNRSSSWKPYIDVLPETYTTPLYFTPSELSLLKGSCTYESSIRMQRNIGRQYAYFWSLFTNQADKYPSMAKHFTFDLYRWAVSTVMTRQNIIPQAKSQTSSTGEELGQEVGGVLALIPLWDMCNHKQGEMLTDYDDDMSECHCYSHTVCEPGDQVYICYSTRPNSDFLVHNGFVYPDNTNDTVQLKLGLAKSDPFIKTRRSLLEKYGITGGDIHVFHLSKRTDNQIPDSLLAFLRIFNASEEELNKLVEEESSSPEMSADQLQPISDENETKCWNFLKVRCSLLLRTYTANFSEAAAGTAEENNSSHVRMSELQIRSETDILRNVITVCDDKL